jgi:hypothetical protein
MLILTRRVGANDTERERVMAEIAEIARSAYDYVLIESAGSR